ncbi:MAG: magnesium transporter CorA family protein [Actinobacteria bacterium]|nr:magnesium transporter CorA family protein [Actinomycetota bacterium]
MISILKTDLQTNETRGIDVIEKGCWIVLRNPSDAEIERVANEGKLTADFLRAALDREESSRIEIEGKEILIILDIPVINFVEKAKEKSVQYVTLPLGIVLNDDIIVTVCLADNKIIDDFTAGRIKSFFTFKKIRFILQILLRVSSYYLKYLKQIDKTSQIIENTLHKSMKNKELIQLLSLEKSLVYFSTSLKANESLLEKMLKLKFLKQYPEDEDLLEDAVIENKQAIEMANIYSNILTGTMDAFASIINNNLNMVMKILTSITIVMSVPTIIGAFFGMNVPVPMGEFRYGFLIIILITGVIAGVVTYILARKNMF